MQISNLTLLRGQPIFVETIGNIYPLTLGEIEAWGEQTFSVLVTLLTFEQQEEGTKNWFEPDLEQKETLLMSWALSLVLKSDVDFAEGTYKSSKGGEVTAHNYQQLAYVLRKQYCLKSEVALKYSSDKARAIAERIKEEKSKLQNCATDLSLSSIISSVAAKHPQLNLFNIWNLTLYQLYDQFQRLQLIDSYEFHTLALLHGAEIKEPPHWSIIFKEDE